MTTARTIARIGAAALIALTMATSCRKEPEPTPPADLSGWIIYTTTDGEDINFWNTAAVNSCIDEFGAYIGPNGERYIHVKSIPEDFQGGFFNFKNLKTIDLTHVDFSNCKTLKNLFYESSSVEKIDMSGLNLQNVTDMSYMFENCANLKELKLKGIDATNAETMESMFKECTSLEEVDFTGVKSSRCSNTYAMFMNCGSLKSYNLAQVGECQKEFTSVMFLGCKSLKTIDLSAMNWKLIGMEDDYKISSTIKGCSPSEIKIPAILTDYVMSIALMGVESDGTLYYPKGSDPKSAIAFLQSGGRKWEAKEY